MDSRGEYISRKYLAVVSSNRPDRSAQRNGRRLKQSKDTALKAFRFQQHPRINQFDVHARLQGLEEKFIVLNREPLAQALRSRLDELSARHERWTPEILSLLLNLSDRPADKTNLLSVEGADEPSELLPQLTWADIIADDPLNEEGIWDDVVIESDYSDEELHSLSDESLAEVTTSTQASSLNDDDRAAFARSFIVSRDQAVLDDVRTVKSQFFQSTSEDRVISSIEITELQAIREILLMLLCLPTALFSISSDSEIHPKDLFHCCTCEPSTFLQALQEFAVIGSQLGRIRTWTISPPKDRLLQRLNAAMLQKLRSFEQSLAQIQQQFLSDRTDTVVSLLETLSRVRDVSQPLLCLVKIVLRSDRSAPAWTILDSLFEVACGLHLADEIHDFTYIAGVFFDCLKVYCGSIILWMTQGKLQDQDDTFFVRSMDENADKGSLWHSRFALLRRSDGVVSAPTFMQSVTGQIFNAGKSAMFLEALQNGRPRDALDQAHIRDLRDASILEAVSDSLLPFSSVFEQELQRWVASLQSHSMPRLRETLFSQCGLTDTLDVIGNLFLTSDGARFQDFGNELFIRMDQQKSWSDRFVLSELAQNAWESSSLVDAAKVSVRASSKPSGSDTYTLPFDDLSRLMLDYAIPWPLKNVINNYTTCQQAFQSSIQVYRAEYLLTKQQWPMQIAKSRSSRKRGQCLALRQRLMWFASTIRSYNADTAMTTMKELRLDLTVSMDVDSMANAYTTFQRRLEARLLLHKNLRPISQSLLSILKICEEFALSWKELVGAGESEEKEGSIMAERRSRRNEEGSAVEVSDEESDTESIPDLHKVHHISTLSKEYERQLHFAIAGLRSVSRLGGEPSWISLVEKLQMGAEHVSTG